MTINDLNNIIISEAEKLGKTSWSSETEYTEFALDIAVKELNKTKVIEPPFYILRDDPIGMVRLAHPDITRRPVILGVIYGGRTEDYPGDNELKQYLLYAKLPNEQYIPLEDILLHRMDLLNREMLELMIRKHRKERLAHHTKHLMELYNVNIGDSSQIHKFIALDYEDMIDFMDYVEEHSEDIPVLVLMYLRKTFKAHHEKKKPSTQGGLRNDT